MKKIALDKLNTEQINQNSRNLHKKTSLEILKIINDEDKKIAHIIKNHLNEINYLIDQIYRIFLKNKNSRLIYIGAGTSGRLGILDASEMEPTFGIKDKIIGLIAGGDIALKKAIENIEDNKWEAINDLKSINFCSNDVLLAISASGY
ncbi:MAG: N-acetylmuramic acid 6-phosphate etherase, partial [Mycoplasma sp.]|nr:N-acetylmuramic acid 6-phosphate etherase [Mycoplasma sp.]